MQIDDTTFDAVELALKIAEFWLVLAAAFVLIEGGCLVQENRQTLRANNQALHDELIDLHRVTLVVGGAAGDVQKMVQQERHTFATQEQSLTAMQGELVASVEALNTLVEHTDESLNGPAGAIPTLAMSIRETSGQAAQLNASVQTGMVQMVSDLHSVTGPTVETISSANKLLADPALPKTLASIQAATESTAKTTAEIEQTYRVNVAPYVARLTKPTRAVWAALKEIGADVSRGFGAWIGAGAK